MKENTRIINNNCSIFVNPKIKKTPKIKEKINKDMNIKQEKRRN